MLVITQVAQLFKAAGDILKGLYASYRRAQDIQSTVRELNKLTNAELNDIGISRGDIYTIAHNDVSDYHDKIRGRV
jgi:uncharacterized protein YjiS (DUF1127 family)